MICPKCFTVEREDGLRCQKCGAQLHTGVFRRPLPEAPEPPEPPGSGSGIVSRASLIAIAVLVVAAGVLLVVLSMLESSGR